MLPGRSFGRLVLAIAGYALLIALMIIKLPVFVPAMLVHCAIRHGRTAAWATLAIAASLAFAIVSVTPAASPELMKFLTGAITGVILAIALPTMAALPWIERGSMPLGRMLIVLLLGSLAGLALTEIGTRAVASYSPYAVYVSQWNVASDELVKNYRASGMPADVVQMAERSMRYSSSVLLPAWLMVGNAISFVLSLLMIGRLRAWRDLTARREPAAQDAYLFRNFALPDWLLFAFIFGGLTPIAKGTLQGVAANVLLVVGFLYMLQGFALLRFLLVSVGVGFAGSLFAFGFVSITGLGLLLLAVAGLFDPFFDFRHYKKRKDDSHESHSD